MDILSIFKLPLDAVERILADLSDFERFKIFGSLCWESHRLSKSLPYPRLRLFRDGPIPEFTEIIRKAQISAKGKGDAEEAVLRLSLRETISCALCSSRFFAELDPKGVLSLDVPPIPSCVLFSLNEFFPNISQISIAILTDNIILRRIGDGRTFHSESDIFDFKVFRNLTSLNVNQFEISPFRIPSETLQSFRVGKPRLKTAGLDTSWSLLELDVSNATNLRYLNIETPLGLRFGKLSKLETIRIPFTQALLLELSTYTGGSLRDITLVYNDDSPNEFPSLTRFTTLRSLSLIGSHSIPEEKVAGLLLESLNIEYPKVIDLAMVKRLPELKKLSLMATVASNGDPNEFCSQIGSCHSLEELSLLTDLSPEGTGNLTPVLGNLKKLGISLTADFPQDDLVKLLKCLNPDKLIDLFISGTSVDDEGVRVISELHNLEALYITMQTNLTNPDFWCMPLSKLTKLRSIFIGKKATVGSGFNFDFESDSGEPNENLISVVGVKSLIANKPRLTSLSLIEVLKKSVVPEDIHGALEGRKVKLHVTFGCCF